MEVIFLFRMYVLRSDRWERILEVDVPPYSSV
jgi:hypothetical protein